MNFNKGNKEGQLLRIERLRQGKAIKEIAGNTCSVSTLSKIERGKQNVDPDMIVKLYKELGIKYENNKDFTQAMEIYIEDYFHEKIYNFEPKSLIALREEKEKLIHSPLSLEWMVIQALEGEETNILKILDECVDFMGEKLLAWYYLIPRHESKEASLEKRIYAHKVLQNSYGTLELMGEYWRHGEYNNAMNLSNKAINYALDEGNTWALSQVYSIMGSIYACYNMEELMIREYEKSINLLKNTNWSHTLEIMYYNIGVTYISLGNYPRARKYLSKCKENNELNFHLLHKWAVLEVKTGNLEEANIWIGKMEKHIGNFEKREKLKEEWNEYHKSYYDEMLKLLQITKLQANGEPEASPDYIPLLESLMEKFFEEGRYGFMLFHKDSLKEAYTKKRLYKDALSLEERFSSLATKSPIK